MKLKPYISIDVETTGINVQTDKILQVAMIFDDGVSKLEDLKTVSFFIDPINEPFTGRLDCEALNMNAWIIKSIADPTQSIYPVYQPEEARNEFKFHVREFYHRVVNKHVRSKDDPKEKIQFAGKNLQGFDIPLLKNNGYIDKDNYKYFTHRVIDVGCLYYPDFGYTPCLGEINRLIGRDPVKHDALNDAADVVAAIRHKMGMII